MYTTTKHPGKFEGNASQLMAQLVYSASLNGPSAELGSVEDGGEWLGLVEGKHWGFILSEDSIGFVTVEAHPLEEAKTKWAELEQKALEFEEANRPPDEDELWAELGEPGNPANYG